MYVYNQVYNSIIHHPYIVLCVHHPKASILTSPFNSLNPLLLPPTPQITTFKIISLFHEFLVIVFSSALCL